ncbi:MAG: YlbF family regulator [Clostridiales bacterium]|nr:YlbF family regulator [Clostridiales bacterium]
MQTIKESLDGMIEVLKESEEFHRYRETRRKVSDDPVKEKRLMEFRRKNYLLQNSDQSVDLFTESDRLMKEYQDLYQDPVVRDFMDAEVAVCKIVQTVNRELITCLEFDDVLVDDAS